MISSKKHKRVNIQITTYNKEKSIERVKAMNEEKTYNKSKNHNTKFICSICLNTKTYDNKNIESDKRKTRSCPICHKNCDYCFDGDSNKERKVETRKAISEMLPSNTKAVQTSLTDITKGLHLLNEVLTVFQSKKKCDSDKERKTVIVKDVSVETENVKTEEKPKLTISKVFCVSIEGLSEKQEGFTIIKPDKENTIDLIKHKSSSIPQMKMEELKNSLKDKTKSKDAIEEVNRMFAIVRKSETRESLDDTNRPLIRHGPRVLPVVKTKENLNRRSEENFTICSDRKPQKQSCKCCQTNNYYMSSGDSFVKNCRDNEKERCDKCVYTLCCHYQKRRMQGVVICECCRMSREYHCKDEGSHGDDSCESF